MMGQSVVQATTVANQVVDHPGGGGSANDEFDVVAQYSPAVPEVFSAGMNPDLAVSIHGNSSMNITFLPSGSISMYCDRA